MKRFDRTRLTPLSIEVIDGRDAVLRVLAGLRDDRKAMMVLTYATASLVDHLARVTRHTPQDVAAALVTKVLEGVDEGLMIGDWPGDDL
jgi:hypothetical protein